MQICTDSLPRNPELALVIALAGKLPEDALY